MKRGLSEISHIAKQERPKKMMKTTYVGDPRLVPRLQQYLESQREKKVVDPGAMADYLQSKFPEYGRRKRLAFRKTVERAYENIRLQASAKENQRKRQADERLGKTGGDSDDENSSEFSDENPEYTSYEDTNAMNSLMRNFYMKPGSRPGSKPASQPVSGASTPIGSHSPYRGSEPESTPTPLFTIDRVGSKNMKDSLKAKMPMSSPKEKVSRQPHILLQQEPKGLEDLDGLVLLPDDVSSVLGSKDQRVREISVIKQTPLAEGGEQKDVIATTPKKSDQPSLSRPVVKKRRKTVDPEEDKKKGPEVTQSKVTFADVGGNDKMLADVCKLLVHLKHPEVYRQLGVTPPRGLLLHGPPGCGKTLLAHAIAGELELPFLKIAATEIVSGVSGESEEKVRDTFQKAMTNAPCVLFMDEIDAITQKRENASKDMERRIVSQLLISMDELSNNPSGHVLVIGATNRPDSLDPALRRAGRFDREIALGIPDQAARERILRVLCRELRLAQGLDLAVLARLTPGYVGADLMALAREAAITAVNRVFKALQAVRKSSERTAIVDNPTSSKAGSALQSTLTDDNCAVNPTPDTADDIEMTEAPPPAREGTYTPPQAEVRSPPEAQKELPMAGEGGVGGEHHLEETGEQTMGGVEVRDKDDQGDEERQGIFIRSLQQTTKKVTADEEELETVLSWLKDQPPLTEEQLDNLWLEMADFEVAVQLVQPSSKREGFATIPDVTWEDIGALRDVREELQMAILAPVRHPEQFAALGLTSPPGILLAGPPGCGKTMLAKAVANESGINFISVKGPELLNMYVGESERAVRQVFQRARNSAPCVIFFDELDALCPCRSGSGEGGSSVRVVNQLLTEMDGLEERKQVFIMGATNRPDIIDPAVLRPGRLDKTLYVGLPSKEDRTDILRTLTKNGTKPRLTPDIDLSAIGSDPRCTGYTGADLAALVREAAVTALRQFMVRSHTQGESTVVGQQHFDAAFSKITPSVSDKERLKYENMDHRLRPL